MYFALLFSITLATGLILHGVASLVSLVVWRISRRRLDVMSSYNAAALLIWLRFFPMALSLFFLAAFVVPSFLAYEPRTTIEPLSFTLLALAGVTAVGLSGSISRCISALLQSRRIMLHWLSDSRLLPQSNFAADVYLSRTAPPVIAAMGLVRTRIFVSHSVVASLSTEELQAALAHEAVHARNCDIAKKMLLQLAPTFLPGIDLLRPVSDQWARTCELLADEQSVAAHPQHTLHLAAALVKVVRLVQDSHLPTLSAALAHSDEPLLTHRIRRLVEISEDPTRMARGRFDMRALLPAGCCLALVIIVVYPHVLSGTHELLEFLVRG